MLEVAREVLGFNPRTREGCDVVFVDFDHARLPFQSTHPRGVRHLSHNAHCVGTVFQSTHPRGVRLSGVLHPPGHPLVSIHAPARGATFVEKVVTIRKQFQSTHPRGVRHNRGCNFRRCSVFQSTHPRGVRRVRFLLVLSVTYVSIHAPARGATPQAGFIRIGWGVSIHAPARGATFQVNIERYFTIVVSIHAPARGATAGVYVQDGRKKFQSTHPRGVRPPFIGGCEGGFRFQSTHPRGVRRAKLE